MSSQKPTPPEMKMPLKASEPVILSNVYKDKLSRTRNEKSLSQDNGARGRSGQGKSRVPHH